MPKVDVNKKRGDPNAQIDLETFWSEVSEIDSPNNLNLTGAWDEDFGRSSYRYQDKENDIIIPLGRIKEGSYASVNLSISQNLIAAGSALSGLGVFRRAILTHLTRTRTPDQLKIIIIDPIKSLGDFDDIPHLAMTRAVSKEEIHVALNWLVCEIERRIHNPSGTLIYLHNQERPPGAREPSVLVLITELGEIGIENNDVVYKLVRFIQMARATEIQTVITTQQPSAEKLPKLILDNVGPRVAFKLPYKETSELIIGKPGAEELLGQGDMIYTDDGSQYVRMQGFHVESGTTEP